MAAFCYQQLANLTVFARLNCGRSQQGGAQCIVVLGRKQKQPQQVVRRTPFYRLDLETEVVDSLRDKRSLTKAISKIKIAFFADYIDLVNTTGRRHR